MTRRTIRIPDELDERIEEARDEDESRSKWVCDAIRAELDRDDRDELRQEIDELTKRVERIETMVHPSVMDRLKDRLGIGGLRHSKNYTDTNREASGIPDDELEELQDRQ